MDAEIHQFSESFGADWVRLTYNVLRGEYKVYSSFLSITEVYKDREEAIAGYLVAAKLTDTSSKWR